MKISKRSKITSSKETADRKTDRRIFPTNVRYKGYMIRLDRGGDGYNVYDTHGELEDAGYTSLESAKKLVDELVAENKKTGVEASSYASNDNWVVVNIEYKLKNPVRLVPVKVDDINNKEFTGWAWGERLYTYNKSQIVYESSSEQDAVDFVNSYEGVTVEELKSENIQASYHVGHSSNWTELESKSVLDSDGFYTDYTLYTNGSTFICMFGDKDIYEPDQAYADYETENEEDAYDWFDNYEGFADEDDAEPEFDIYASESDSDEDDLVFIDNRKSSIVNNDPSLDPGFDEYDVYSSEDFEDHEDDLDHPDQEYDSAATSINSTKLPAIYRMIKLQPGTVGVDFGGGKFDNAIEYLRDQDVTLCVYDPYNRSAEHNREVLRTLRANGGADFAINSNVLNVIKEPEARKGVLENIKKITKSGAPIYITVYEGRGDAKEGVTKSGYQLNRKTADYLEEIQEVFPDAKRRGKLIVATNKGSANSSVDIKASSEIIWDDLDWNQQIQVMKRYIRNYKGTRIFEDFADYINKPVEDIIDSFCDAESRGDIRIPERMQLDSEYRNDDIYSTSVNSSVDIKASSTEGYVYTYCDECGKKNRVKVTFNNFNEPFNDTEYKCKYCGTNNLLTDPHSYDENGNVVEAAISNLSFYCPVCHNKTLYSLENEIRSPMDVDYREIFVCDECASEFEAYPQYDGSIKFKEYYREDDVDDEYIDSSTNITAASKLWMGKYKSAEDNKMHKVYFEFDTSDFEEAEQEFEDIIPEPYSYARLLGTAPHEALLQKDGFEKIQSSSSVSSRYWYFTRHGVQPGSVPKYVNILDIVDKPEGSYFLADGVILTKDLRDYDIKERKPEDSVTSSTLIKSKGNNQYTDADIVRSSKSIGKYFGLIYYTPDSGENGMEGDKFDLSDCGEFNSIEEAKEFWNEYLLRDKGKAFVSEITKEEYEDWLAESELQKDWESSYNQSHGTVNGSTNEYSDILEEIREQCNTKLIHIMAQYGFDESEAKQYSRVDASIDDQYGRIEIGCELDYDGLIRVCQELDPIVQAYDPDSYFEPVDSGIAEAWVNLEKASIDSSSNIQAGAYDFPEPSLDPPEYPEPEEVDDHTQKIDLNLDAVIEIDQLGDWEYQDENYPWARCKDTKDGSWYSDEYDVFIADPVSIVERVDELLISKLPEKEGTYRIKGNVHLEYVVSNLSKYVHSYGPDDYDEDIDTDNAYVDFDFYNSNISDFRLTKI